MDSDNSSVTVKTQPYVIFCSEAFYDCDNSTGTIKTRTVYRARSICKKAVGFFQVQYLELYFSFSLIIFCVNSCQSFSRLFVILEGILRTIHVDSFPWCAVRLIVDLSQSSKASWASILPKIQAKGCAKSHKCALHPDTIPGRHVLCDKNTPSYLPAKNGSSLPGRG